MDARRSTEEAELNYGFPFENVRVWFPLQKSLLL
jgi:hypothetical protein